MKNVETKVMQVRNSTEVINQYNNDQSCFGWEVMNVQITHSQNTKTYSSAWDILGGNETATVETTTINYATITYKRDSNMPHYEEIVSLERKYDSIIQAMADCGEPPIGNFWIEVILFLLYIIPCFIYKRYINKKRDEYDRRMNELNAQRREILVQAANVMRS